MEGLRATGCAWRQADMLAKASAEFGECRETALGWDAFMAALDRRHMVLAPWCGLTLGKPCVESHRRLCPWACEHAV